MRHWGYLDARADPGGADGGIDVRSARALGQVKYQAAAVGRPALQLLFGARGQNLDKQLLFFTGSSYTTTALDYGRANDIALFVYHLDGSMEAINPQARRITETSRVAEEASAAAAVRIPETDRGTDVHRVEAARREALGHLAAAVRVAATPDPAPVPSAAASPAQPPAPASPTAAPGPAAPPQSVPAAPRPRPETPAAVPPRELRPGTGRLFLGLFLAVIALTMPGSESFTPRPDRTVVTAVLLVIPCILLVWGVTTKSRRRFWPTGLSLFLLDLPLAWVTNTQLWQGDVSDLFLPTTPAVLCTLTAVLLIRWNAKRPEPSAPKD
jgi:hypothetical protein